MRDSVNSLTLLLLVPIGIALYFIYTVDILLSLYSSLPLWLAILLTLLVGTFPIFIAAAPLIPLSLSIEAFSGAFTTGVSPWGRLTRIIALPVGIVAALIIWEVINWLFYGVLEVEPRIHNTVFGWLLGQSS